MSLRIHRRCSRTSFQTRHVFSIQSLLQIFLVLSDGQQERVAVRDKAWLGSSKLRVNDDNIQAKVSVITVGYLSLAMSSSR